MVTSKLWHHLLDMVNKFCNRDGGILLNCSVYFLLEAKRYSISVNRISDLIKLRKTLIFPFVA